MILFPNHLNSISTIKIIRLFEHNFASKNIHEIFSLCLPENLNNPVTLMDMVCSGFGLV